MELTKMHTTRDDLQKAFQASVMANGRRQANLILAKAVGSADVISVREVADDKIKAAAVALKASAKPTVKSFADLHSTLAKMSADIFGKRNAHEHAD